jgi:hypothetical protein
MLMRTSWALSNCVYCGLLNWLRLFTVTNLGPGLPQGSLHGLHHEPDLHRLIQLPGFR